MQMQPAQIKQQFTQAEQVIQRAAKAVQSDKSATQELKDCITELDSQTKEARQMFQEGNNPQEDDLVQCIDDLEATSDRAKQACVNAQGLSQQSKSAVQQAHDKLSELKKQLH